MSLCSTSYPYCSTRYPHCSTRCPFAVQVIPTAVQVIPTAVQVIPTVVQVIPTAVQITRLVLHQPFNLQLVLPATQCYVVTLLRCFVVTLLRCYVVTDKLEIRKHNLALSMIKPRQNAAEVLPISTRSVPVRAEQHNSHCHRVKGSTVSATVNYTVIQLYVYLFILSFMK